MRKRQPDTAKTLERLFSVSLKTNDVVAHFFEKINNTRVADFRSNQREHRKCNSRDSIRGVWSGEVWF